MYDFHISDLAMFSFSGSKFYWQNFLTNSCIFIRDNDSMNPSSDGEITIYFMQGAPGSKVIPIYKLDRSKEDYTSVDILGFNCPDIYQSHIKVVRKANSIQLDDFSESLVNNSIFTGIVELLNKRSWEFPRRYARFPYLTSVECQMNETVMREAIEIENDRHDVFLGIDRAGVLLAERMGLPLDGIIKIKHYDMSKNAQVDSLVDNIEIEFLNGCSYDTLENKMVVIIDDLISSGRTAVAVVDYLRAKYQPYYMTFYSLYRTNSSQEVPIEEGVDICYRWFFPLSNAYWVYGRGFDLYDEESRTLPDIYGSLKCWDNETKEDIKEILEFFDSPFSYDDYLKVLLE